MSYILPGKKVTAFGVTFDSKDEYHRYLELRQMQNFGDIQDLRCHPEFELIWNGVLIKNYTADFDYTIVKTQEYVVEDVKSLSIQKKRNTRGEMVTKKYGTASEREWILTRKMMKAAHGIEVRQVLMNRSVRSLVKNGYDIND